MSRIALNANASGSGVFTIESPNSDTDRTLNLPDKAGTVQVGSGIDDNATSTAITINSSEYVGVGTTNPTDLVTLSGSGSQPAIRLITDAGTYNGVYHRIFPAGDGTALAISADKGNSGAGSYIRFDVDDTEHMRIDSSGRVGIGTGSDAINGDSQLHVKTGNVSGMMVETTADSYAHLQIKSSEGYWGLGLRPEHNGGLSLRNNGSGAVPVVVSTAGVASFGTANTKVSMYSDSTYSGIYNGSSLLSDECIFMGGDHTYFYASGSEALRLNNVILYSRHLRVLADNTYDIGTSSGRYNDAYITNGVVTGSDERLKQDISALDEAETRVAVACKGLLRKWRWKDAVEEKGDDARIHFGIIAQDLKAAFEAEGLDAGRYGMFIHTTWTDEETGEERDRMGVRYSELLAFIIAAI